MRICSALSVVGDGGNQPRVLNGAGLRPIPVVREGKSAVQHDTDQLVRLFLCGNQIAERIHAEHLPSVGSLNPLAVLNDVRMVADNDVRAPVRYILCGCPLLVCHIMAVLHAPVAADDNRVCRLPCLGNLLLNGVCLAHVDHPLRRICGLVVVRHLCVGQKGNLITVFLQNGDIAVVSGRPESGGDNSLILFRVPEIQCGLDAVSQIVINMVVAQTEDVKARINQRLSVRSGGGENGVAARLIDIVDQGFHVNPGSVMFLNKRRNALIEISEIVGAVCAAGRRLLVKPLVDQVVAARHKADLIHRLRGNGHGSLGFLWRGGTGGYRFRCRDASGFYVIGRNGSLGQTADLLVRVFGLTAYS